MRFCHIVIVSILLLTFYHHSAKAQSIEYHVASNIILDRYIDLQRKPDGVNMMNAKSIQYLPLKDGPFNQHPQALLQSDSATYIYLRSTGVLFKYMGKTPTDSLIFKRIDITTLGFYNINAFPFTDKDDVYNLGGYGFWQWTGHLRHYRTDLGEWEVIRLNREVPTIQEERPSIWHDRKNRKIYALGYKGGNESVISEIAPDVKLFDSVMVLDLKKLAWQSLGRIHPEAMKMLLKSVIIAPTKDGILCNLDGSFIFINILKNQLEQIDFINKTFNQSMISRHYTDLHFWTENEELFIWNERSNHLDSLQINEQKFKAIGIPLYEPLSKTILTSWWLLGLLPIGGWFVWKKMKRKKNAPSAKTIKEHSPTPAPTVAEEIKPVTSKQIFTTVETELIQLLLTNQQENKRYTTTEEINRTLGVAFKSSDMQKRKRSNTIKNINEKYAILYPTSNLPLIQRVKCAEDGRLHEFFIEESEIGNTLLN